MGRSGRLVLVVVVLVVSGCSVQVGATRSGDDLRSQTEDFLVEQFAEALPAVDAEVSCAEADLLVVPCRVVVDGRVVAYEGVLTAEGSIDIWPVGVTVVDGRRLEGLLVEGLPVGVTATCPVFEVVAIGEPLRCELDGPDITAVDVVFADPQGTIASVEPAS
jgi:hypothetical protein